MSLDDIKFSSYACVHTSTDSNATANTEYNPFKSDQYNTYTATTVASRDVSYSSTTGKFTFEVPGTYFVLFDIPGIVSSGTGVEGRIFVNTTEVYTSTALFANNSIDPRSYTFFSLVEVNAGDTLNVTVKTIHEGKTLSCQAGSQITLFRVRGDYGSIAYTADSTSTTGTRFLGDSDFGGTIETKLKNVTYTASTGKLTPDNTSTFLMMQNLSALTDANTDVAVDHFANGSKVAGSTFGVYASSDPKETTYAILKSLTGGQTAGGRMTPSVGTANITIEQGSSFTIIDVSRDGSNPSAMQSVTCGSDSNALSSGSDTTCFSSAAWSSYNPTSHVTATGITYTQSNGRFTFANAGKYLIYCNLVLNVSTGTTFATKVKKNGSSTVYTGNIYIHNSFDPQEKTICLIIEADASDYIEITANPSAGSSTFDKDCAISILKIDEFDEVYGEIASADQIGDDYIINSLNSDVIGRQKHNTIDRSLPSSTVIPGPRNLRGRTTSYAPSLGGKVKK